MSLTTQKKIANILAKSFMTAECKSNDNFAVVIKTDTLAETQALHQLLVLLAKSSQPLSPQQTLIEKSPQL